MKSFLNSLSKGIGMIFLIRMALTGPLQAQIVDPHGALILNTLREIAMKHNLGLQEQRAQTAQMVEQLRQFYDTYTLLRNDVDFTRNLYRDLQAMQHLDFTQSYVLNDFIINADRLDYWFPSFQGNMQRTAMDLQSMFNRAAELQQAYDSFTLPGNAEEIPQDAPQRLENARAGEAAFSRAMFEYGMKCRAMAESYDEMAAELHQQIMEQQNSYTVAERTQLLTEAVRLREFSNNYYEKFLEISRKSHQEALENYDDNLNRLRSRVNWKELGQHLKSVKIRYGLYDALEAPLF